MNLLIVTPDFPPSYGGIGQHVYDLVLSLKNYVSKICICVARLEIPPKKECDSLLFNLGENVFVKEFSCDSVEYKSFFFEKGYETGNNTYESIREIYYNLALFKSLYEYLCSLDISFDLMHVHDGFNAGASVAIKNILKIPLILTMHTTNAPKDYLIDSFRRYISHNANKIICVSDDLKHEIENRYNLQNKSCFVIHNGINIHNKYQIKENNSIKIAFAGRLHDAKGVDILIKAFQLVKSRSKCCAELIVIGDGDKKNDLHKLCEELNLSNQIKFTGYLSNDKVRHIFHNSDIVVIPSRKEAFGLVAIEAMAEGACVVCSNVGGLIEIIGHNVNGMLFKSENYEELASIIEFLINNYSKRSQLALEGYYYAINTHDWVKIAEKTLLVYNESL